MKNVLDRFFFNLIFSTVSQNSFGLATSFPKNCLFLVEQLRRRGKQNKLLKRSGAIATRESKNGHEMVAVCQRRPGEGSQPPFLIQGGKCTLWALYLTVEHWQCTSRAILELIFKKLFHSEVMSCEVNNEEQHHRLLCHGSSKDAKCKSILKLPA